MTLLKGLLEMDFPIPLPIERAIRKFGTDISLARRRRHISQASLAERMGASLSTVRRMEKGDGRVPIHFLPARCMSLAKSRPWRTSWTPPVTTSVWR